MKETPLERLRRLVAYGLERDQTARMFPLLMGYEREKSEQEKRLDRIEEGIRELSGS